MTEENYNYRTSQILLRNQFPGKGKLKIPVIPKFQPRLGDFDDLLLIGFDKTNLEDQNHLDRMVHFFLYDYRFERVWKNPDSDIEKLSRYRAVLSPDFSMYLEMAPVMQLYNVFRNRWCGAYWASKGIRVIPTVNWGDESTFAFCFEGIEIGSTVAVSTYMASAHDNRQDQKEWFMAGYNEMLRRIKPEKIICYNTPFPEMQGDVVFVDYNRSSWRYMNYERSYKAENLDAFKVGGQPQAFYDTISLFIDVPLKGGGSAYGGQWRPNPNKPNDAIYWGPANTIRRVFISTRKGGYWATVKYDSIGRAVLIRHETVHVPNGIHSNPHDHIIRWIPPTFRPDPSPPINYFDGNIPEIKRYEQEGLRFMNLQYDPEAYRFKTISDFKWSMKCGSEIQFDWKGISYCCYGTVCPAPGQKSRMVIAQAGSAEVLAQTGMWCDTADEVLEYMVGDDRLRDVITQVTVTERTI